MSVFAMAYAPQIAPTCDYMIRRVSFCNQLFLLHFVSPANGPRGLARIVLLYLVRRADAMTNAEKKNRAREALETIPGASVTIVWSDGDIITCPWGADRLESFCDTFPTKAQARALAGLDAEQIATVRDGAAAYRKKYALRNHIFSSALGALESKESDTDY